jgi:hypothetical protein
MGSARNDRESYAQGLYLFSVMSHSLSPLVLVLVVVVVVVVVLVVDLSVVAGGQGLAGVATQISSLIGGAKRV